MTFANPSFPTYPPSLSLQNSLLFMPRLHYFFCVAVDTAGAHSASKGSFCSAVPSHHPLSDLRCCRAQRSYTLFSFAFLFWPASEQASKQAPHNLPLSRGRNSNSSGGVATKSLMQVIIMLISNRGGVAALEPPLALASSAIHGSFADVSSAECARKLRDGL